MFWIKRIASGIIAILFCFLIDTGAHHAFGFGPQRIIGLIGIYVTLAVSLNLINGITGQFSIGHAAFYQVGAYLTGYFTRQYIVKPSEAMVPVMGMVLIAVTFCLCGLFLTNMWPWKWRPHLILRLVMLGASLFVSKVIVFLIFQKLTPALPHLGFSAVTTWPWLILMIFLGAAGASVAGFMVGLPSLRLKGDYLAIVTLGFGEIIRIVVQNTDEVGGPYALDHIPKIQDLWLIWLVAIICIAVCRNLLKTARGLTFLAVREDEIASSAMGVNVTRVKVTAFVLGSAFAGAAGALLAHWEGLITPTTFTMDVSFIILTMVVLGGTGSITGSVFAAMFLSYLPEYLRTLKGADGQALVVTGTAVVAALIVTALAVAAIKTVLNRHIATPKIRGGIYVGIVVAAILLERLVSAALSPIHSLAAMQIEAAQLRMVIFAVTLIVLMLLRPQGIFAHHEFSWSWVKKLMGIQPVPATEVSA